MMKFVLLSLTITSLFVMIGCGCPTTSIPTGSITPRPSASLSIAAQQLAERFCPFIYLKGDGDNVENYEPTQIEILIDESFVRDIYNPSFQEKATLAGFLQWSKSIYYLDIIGIGPAIESFNDYLLNYSKIRIHYKPTVYARVIEQLDGVTVLQYWMFYYFNDWRNFHEGDWELIQLDFQGQTAKEILELHTEPVSASYSQHQAGQRMSWINMKEAGVVNDTHPVVYIAKGSHANYFAPGNFWAGLDFDYTGLSSWQIYRPNELSIMLLPDIETSEAGFEWLDFKGYWGEYLGFSVSLLGLRFWQHGPFGPAWKENEEYDERWQNPVKWANKLPEYPEPFWTYFFDVIADWAKLAIFSIFSPADLHVYDSQGRHVGLDEQGRLETQIPGAMYVTPEGTDYKFILIPDADISSEYSVLAKGSASGTMDMKAQVPDTQRSVQRFLEYLGVPVSSTTVARATIKPVALEAIRAPAAAVAKGGTEFDTFTALEIDNDGDGIFEAVTAPGQFIRRDIRPPE